MADDPQNKSRIVIEGVDTPAKPAKKPDMDRAGRMNPWTPKWHQQREGRRRESRRA
jgi:hypothetical protein